MKSTLLLLLLSATTVLAQTDPCPLHPGEVKNLASQIFLTFQNTTGKQVASYTFGLSFSEVNGKKHDFPQLLSEAISLKSRGRRTAIWHSPLSRQFLYPLATAYLQQATFTDGTDWRDDGSHSCSVTSMQE